MSDKVTNNKVDKVTNNEAEYNTSAMDIDTAIAKILEAEASPEMIKIKELLMQRIAGESVIRPSRIQAPQNITQIGGYFNLLMDIQKAENTKNTSGLANNKMLEQALCAILGLPEKY